ncbi:hypothetical protein I3843_06G011400 [Carya illinoinensis]|uniref:Aquaporin NIP-type n=1 Tax=Carya illinoinensis TaxID=32201 RepID=A0A922ESB9_CARIL|nr:hypothetical protein I3760_06G011700 [Carya illinoinensis]KAG6707058.1 hypothetical protein I3842_06G012200 [Carya illinoinensis]KAG7973734.1 hypothetical protein I3843_06G011400 [Carya illinoinensis]
MSSREITTMEIGESSTSDRTWGLCTSSETDQLIQKVIAEFIGTFFLIFAGCGSVAVNKIYGSVSFPGICMVWGLIVMVMVYSVGHISGAHFNPAVTLTFAIYRHFPLKQVPLYVIAQMLGSILASATLCAVFPVDKKSFFGTVPVGSNIQALFIEIIISFLLMFVISGVSTDTRAMMFVGLVSTRHVPFLFVVPNYFLPAK